MKNLISIIIPTYNRYELIGTTINSIQNQSYKNWECLIIDDGSNDYTAELLSFYCNRNNKIKFYKRPSNRPKGASSCRNYGFELCNGNYVKFFDSDDIMLEHCLALQINSFKQKTDVSICKIKEVGIEDNRTIKITTIASKNPYIDYLLGKITYYVSGPLWKKKFLKKQHELFDSNIRNLDDWDFNLRMLRANPRIALINHPQIIYRKHKESLSNKIIEVNFNEIKSEMLARRKQVLGNIFKNYKSTSKFREFVIVRNKFFLRRALLNNSRLKYFLHFNLIFTQIISMKFYDFSKSIFGLITYTLFNKGYKFFR